ncbi:MAG: internal scaffolding protein [Microviridae sp.]|nr:MAG: internal scaffolding protein [Microviridae sp.]
MDKHVCVPVRYRSAVQGEYDTWKVSRESGLECKDPSLARQDQKDEADINVIVRDFGLTGKLPLVAVPPTYEDFAHEVDDFQTAANLMLEANRSFMAMDAKVRAKFENDPAQFVEFCSNKDNLDEMRKMGLALPREPVDGGPVQVETVVGGIQATQKGGTAAA